MKNTSIAQKNDLLRKSFSGCRVMLTAGVADSEKQTQILDAVKSFHQFTEDNDPYGEHDFAFLEVNGEKFFFKFDYYDSNYEFFQEDGNRVLTIGRADEY
ncbi:MAG: DUF3768 domain-containing protein [Bdellovibrionales bacterium]